MCFTLPMDTSNYQKWLSQLRKGYLELCVLVILERKTCAYGLQILQLFEKSGVSVNEGTLYPLLNRMNKNGWLQSYWETPTAGGHPKRYYKLSEQGKGMLPDMLIIYSDNQNSLANLRALK